MSHIQGVTPFDDARRRGWYSNVGSVLLLNTPPTFLDQVEHEIVPKPLHHDVGAQVGIMSKDYSFSTTSRLMLQYHI